MNLLRIIGIIVGSATLFGSGWWCATHFYDGNHQEVIPTATTNEPIQDNQNAEEYQSNKDIIPEYQMLQNAKWIDDLPPKFTSVMLKGKTEDLESIIYSEGMPEDLAHILTEKIALLSKGYKMIDHGIGESRWRSFNAGVNEGRRMRYLIYPTHFMVFSVFTKKGPPTELSFGLALTADGIQIVGMKYADMNIAQESEQAAPSNR